jgi:two-component system OmpR family response regulator
MAMHPAPESGFAPRAILKFEQVQQVGMRVLIVEDDNALADGLLRTLRQSGYAVDHAGTGELALRACAEEHYDLVVLDISLPGIDGFDVLRQLRRSGQAGSILILTAHDAEADRVRGLDLGADDYVTKPFSLPEFEARVRALIRRSQAVKSPRLHFGGLMIDTVARRASIGDESLDLTPREWAVLEYLLMRVGQVVSKEHMLQAMCSWDDSLTHNAIEVYISRLRSKLQHAGVRIRTVRGFGYMLEEPDEY